MISSRDRGFGCPDLLGCLHLFSIPWKRELSPRTGTKVIYQRNPQAGEAPLSGGIRQEWQAPAKCYGPTPCQTGRHATGDVAAVTELKICQGGAPPPQTPRQLPQRSRTASSKDGNCPITPGGRGVGAECLMFEKKKKGVEAKCLTWCLV